MNVIRQYTNGTSPFIFLSIDFVLFLKFVQTLQQQWCTEIDPYHEFYFSLGVLPRIMKPIALGKMLWFLRAVWTNLPGEGIVSYLALPSCYIKIKFLLCFDCSEYSIDASQRHLKPQNRCFPWTFSGAMTGLFDTFTYKMKYLPLCHLYFHIGKNSLETGSENGGGGGNQPQ